jgi:Sulfatase
VVASDHGVAFDLGKRDRRRLTEENYEEIAPVPLFVKAPGQKRGRIDDSYVETIDILPTIFDVLNLRPPAKMDGRSAFSAEVRERDELRILERNTFRTLRIDGDEYEAAKRKILDKKLRLFGTGADGPERMYRIGPNQELIGKPADTPGLEPLDVDFAYAREYRNVRTDSPTIPTHVAGQVRSRGGARDVAIAVNGRIRAVSRTFRLTTGGGWLVAAMVPESSFEDGANEVEVFEVTG